MEENNHSINLKDRKDISISGVKKVENFDEKAFLLDTNMGPLKINGHCLEIVKLDTLTGNITIKGKINSLIYLESNKNKESFINKLFK